MDRAIYDRMRAEVVASIERYQRVLDSMDRLIPLFSSNGKAESNGLVTANDQPLEEDYPRKPAKSRPAVGGKFGASICKKVSQLKVGDIFSRSMIDAGQDKIGRNSTYAIKKLIEQGVIKPVSRGGGGGNESVYRVEKKLS